MRPAVQNSHRPHGIAAITWTRSPGAHPVTSAPTSTTSPAISCPMTRGGSMWWCPKREIFTSVPHVEHARTRILTSRGPGDGSGASSIRTSPGAWKRTTLMVLLGVSARAGRDAGEHLQDDVDRLGPAQGRGPVGVEPDRGEAREDVDVPVAARRDADAHLRRLPGPVHAVREAHEAQRVPDDGVLAREGRVRDRHALADVGGHGLLALEHRGHVLRPDGADLDQEVTREPDGLGLVGRALVEPHRLAHEQGLRHRPSPPAGWP